MTWSISAPDCVFIFTSGWSPIPGSENVTDWRWNISSFHTKPLNYENWASGQPDNFNNEGQDVIGLLKKSNYQWADLGQYKREIQCHVCECHDP